MMEATDHDLLRLFKKSRDESAFRRLVDRHLGMVFGVAERMTGDRGLAEEVAQTTFATLAAKGNDVDRGKPLAGWLYHTARNFALHAVRAEARRRQREQIAAAMNFNEPGPNVVAEHLESAMDQLKPDDRDALVLRYFEDRNLRDVGLELGLSEDAARMRVNRALEKLRGILGKLGIAGSVAWLTTTLPTSASAIVPAGLAASITTAVLSGTVVVTTAAITHGASTMMNILNLKTGAAALAAAAITGTSTYLVKNRETNTMQSDLQALNAKNTKLAGDQQQALAAIKLRDDQIEQMKKDIAELPRLRGQVDALNRKLAEMDALKLEATALRKQIQLYKEDSNEIAGSEATGQTSSLSNSDTVTRRLEERYGLPPGSFKPMDEAGKLLIHRLDENRQLGLAIVMYADDNGGKLPRSCQQIVPYIHENKLDPGFLDQVEMRLQGAVPSGLSNDVASQTIVAQEKDAVQSGNGFERIYIFLDGHSEVHREPTLQQLAAWEQTKALH